MWRGPEARSAASREPLQLPRGTSSVDRRRPRTPRCFWPTLNWAQRLWGSCRDPSRPRSLLTPCSAAAAHGSCPPGWGDRDGPAGRSGAAVSRVPACGGAGRRLRGIDPIPDPFPRASSRRRTTSERAPVARPRAAAPDAVGGLHPGRPVRAEAVRGGRPEPRAPMGPPARARAARLGAAEGRAPSGPTAPLGRSSRPALRPGARPRVGHRAGRRGGVCRPHRAASMTTMTFFHRLRRGGRQAARVLAGDPNTVAISAVSVPTTCEAPTNGGHESTKARAEGAAPCGAIAPAARGRPSPAAAVGRPPDRRATPRRRPPPAAAEPKPPGVTSGRVEPPASGRNPSRDPELCCDGRCNAPMHRDNEGQALDAEIPDHGDDVFRLLRRGGVCGGPRREEGPKATAIPADGHPALRSRPAQRSGAGHSEVAKPSPGGGLSTAARCRAVRLTDSLAPSPTGVRSAGAHST